MSMEADSGDWYQTPVSLSSKSPLIIRFVLIGVSIEVVVVEASV